MGEAPAVPEAPLKREASGPARTASDAVRRKTKTQPPPPPGSLARKALDEKILELRAVYGADDAPPPPPAPAPARAAASKPRAGRLEPPPVEASPEIDRAQENRGAVGVKHDRSPSISTNSASGTIGGDTPPPIFDRAAIAAGQRARAGAPDAPSRRLGSPPGGDAHGGPVKISPTITGAVTAVRQSPRMAAGSDRLQPPPLDGAVTTVLRAGRSSDDAAPRLAVPIGEFDPGQATVKRDTANALLRAGEPAAAMADDDEAGGSAFDEPTRRGGEFGEPTRRMAPPPALPAPPSVPDRGDPTVGDFRGDATAHAPPAAGKAVSLSGTLRPPAALRRRRGIAGDLRYVATVVFGLRDARRELAAITMRQVTRQQSRRHHLVTLGRAAVGADRLDHPALGDARNQLAAIEDERSQHAGQVFAADSELVRVRREREARAAQCATELTALDTELAAQGRKLEPLHKDVAGIKKRGGELHDALREIDGKIAATEAKLDQLKAGQIKAGKLDRGELQAEIATLKADRKVIQSDEPVIAGQLDALSPRIAALEASRSEAQRKRAELQAAERDDQRRVEELLTAIGAKRKVVDRAAADAEVRRDRILFQLGERLYVDRPANLTAELSPIDEIDLELGSADRRMMELREILGSVDRWKLARGTGVLLGLLGAVGALAVLAISLAR